MPNYTPGPWNNERICLKMIGHSRIITNDGQVIAEVVFQDANAHLIAAAPDLLSATEELLALVLDFLNSNNMGQMVVQDYARLNEAPMQARAALKLAKGGA